MSEVNEWLISLSEYIGNISDELDKAKAENDRLRAEVEQWHRLTAGIELPEYPITEFKPKDLERENAKLRELVRNLYICARSTDCDECPYIGEPCDFEYDLREVGVEADG